MIACFDLRTVWLAVIDSCRVVIDSDYSDDDNDDDYDGDDDDEWKIPIYSNGIDTYTYDNDVENSEGVDDNNAKNSQNFRKCICEFQ